MKIVKNCCCFCISVIHNVQTKGTQHKSMAKSVDIHIGRWLHRSPSQLIAFEFFTVCTKLAEIAILYSKDLTTAKKSYL